MPLGFVDDPRLAVGLELGVEPAPLYVVAEQTLVGENESIYIPLGAVHRMENPGNIPLELIEVQSGSYLGEDDIVRLEDRYGRPREDRPGAEPAPRVALVPPARGS